MVIRMGDISILIPLPGALNRRFVPTSVYLIVAVIYTANKVFYTASGGDVKTGDM